MQKTIAFFLAATMLLTAPCASAKKKELPEADFVDPSFYEVELDMIWVFPMIDEMPSGEPFADKRDLKPAMGGLLISLRKRRNYKAKRVKDNQTAYRSSVADIESEDTEWMSTLDSEGKRFVFLIRLVELDEDVDRKKDRAIVVAGYLFDTGARKLLWRGESRRELGGDVKNAVGSVLASPLFLAPVFFAINATRKFEDALIEAGRTLGKMFPKSKFRTDMAGGELAVPQIPAESGDSGPVADPAPAEKTATNNFARREVRSDTVPAAEEPAPVSPPEEAAGTAPKAYAYLSLSYAEDSTASFPIEVRIGELGLKRLLQRSGKGLEQVESGELELVLVDPLPGRKQRPNWAPHSVSLNLPPFSHTSVVLRTQTRRTGIIEITVSREDEVIGEDLVGEN